MDDIRRALKVICASRHVAHSASLIRFLEYVVEQKLAGKEEEIREAALGAVVFQRGRNFDPRIDPVVRVEARRLRMKLAAYYSAEGAADRVRIELPRGGYVPDFKFPATEPQSAEPQPPVSTSRFPNWRLAAVILGLTAAVAVGFRFWPRPAPAAVAVLPIVNLTGDPANDYLCDGLAAELTGTLARLPQLRVTASTSTIILKGKAIDARGIGVQLGVGHLMEGSVLRLGDQVRLTLAVSRTSDGSRVMSRSYEGGLLDLTGRQTELAAPLVAALDPGARAPERRKPAPEAHDLFLKAAALRAIPGEEAFRKSLAYLNEAIRIDPEYADAYAALADRYVTTGANLSPAPLELIKLGKATAARALQLDPNCAAAYGAMGYANALYLLDWKAGEDELRHAIRLDPSGNEFYQSLGRVLMYQGRFDEAQVQFRKSEELDPLSAVSSLFKGIVLYYQRRWNEAAERFQSVERSHPEYLMVHWWLALVWLEKGETVKAEQEIRRLPASLADFAKVGLLTGRARFEEAKALLEKLEHPAPGQGPPRAFNLGCIYAALGDSDRAFKWLEQAYQDRKITQVKVEPLLDPIRGDPRYAELLRKTGLGR